MSALPEDPPEDDLDHTRAPLIEHIIELRRRLIYSAIAFVGMFVLCFYFATEIYAFLAAPLYAALPPDQQQMIFTAPQEAFLTELKLAFWGAFMLAFPVIASQIWMFVAPGLYKNERRAFLPFLLVTPFLFTAGAALAYYFIFPLAWEFFLGFGSEDLAPLPKVSEYLSISMRIIFAFGAAFLLPVALTLLARVGLTSSAWLARQRRYAIVLAFVAAAILTPPDPVSQLGLGIPIILLYELSIWAAKLVERKRREAQEADI